VAKACARHILVKTREEAEKLKQQLTKGADFFTLAKKHSFGRSLRRAAQLDRYA